MRFKKTLSAVITAAMLSSVIASAGAVSASAAAAATVDGIDLENYSSYTTYDGNDLGANYTPEATTFKVWAPSSTDVKLKLYATGSDKEEGAEALGEYQMELNKNTGVWSVKVQGDLKNQYYTYLVTNSASPNGVEVVDIYAKAAGVNGNRAMVVDLDSTDPEGWENDSRQLVNSPTEATVWEIHIKDFSYDPESGVSEQNRGKYMAFTEFETTLNNAGDVKTCMNYLKDLGINYVQINPMYDFGSVDEASGDDTQFNWGYDPKNYNVPEGSYSSNPYDGNVRIKEMKEMIKALHENGIGVIMDVVYNHTYASDTSWFNLTVPGYYYRQGADGTGWSNGSGCGNDTASEREMFKKYMVESVTYWADEYHLDGFRFDLMGLHDYYTMNAVRESLDQIDTKILTYGEGWTMGTYPDDYNWAGERTKLCTQGMAKRINSRIGFFNDDVRDALKGKAYDDLTSPGFVSGSLGVANSIYSSAVGHYESSKWRTAEPGQNVVYSCCHDNQTLWDRLVASEYGTEVADSVYDQRNETFVAGNKLSAAVVFTSQGLPFILAGEEFARTKYGDHNSYRSSPDINKLDWSRAAEYADVVSYYKGLIKLRHAFPGFADSTLETGKAAEKIEGSSGSVAYSIPNLIDTSGNTWSKMVMLFNPSRTDEMTFELPGASIAMGDIDGDGKITSNDALDILRHSTNIIQLTGAQLAAADLDGDGVIKASDALKALRISVHLEDAPEASSDGGTEYSILVDDQSAGLEELGTVTNTATVKPCSAMILVPKADYDKAGITDADAENSGTVVVNHIDKSTGEVLYKTTIRGTVGQGYTTQPAGNLSLEYDFDSVTPADSASGTIAKGESVVNYYYTPYPGGVGSVTVKYVDEQDRLLADSIVTRARAGETYTSTLKGFPWYKLVEIPENAEGEYTSEPIEVIYRYQSTDEVVENTIYVRMGENTSFTPYLHVWNIYNPENQAKDYGTSWPGVKLEDEDGDGWYSYTFQNGNGYNWILNDNNGSQTADMSSSGDIWVVANGAAAKVTVTNYNPDLGEDDPSTDVVKSKLIVRHVDQDGNDIAGKKSETQRPVGTEYTTNPIEDEWYILDETQLPDNAEGVYTEEDIEVVYHYNAVPTNEVTVHLKLAEGADFTPWLYFWGAKTPCSWPGYEMTDEDKDGWFEFTLETGETYNWIINDHNGTQTTDYTGQSGDVWIIADSASSVTPHSENPDKGE